MRFQLIYGIAWSLLMARWRQTLIAAVGVMFSITMFVTLLSFMNGLNDMLDGLVVNRTAHIKLYNDLRATPLQPMDRVLSSENHIGVVHSVKPKDELRRIRNYVAVAHTLRSHPEVRGISPKVTSQAIFNAGATDLPGAINGIDVASEMDLFHFDDYVIEGNAMDLRFVPNSILLGKSLADKLLAKKGDNIRVTTTDGANASLKVVGFYQSGLEDFDKANAFCHISNVQKLLGYSDAYVTDIHVKLFHVEKAPVLGRWFSTLFQLDAEDIQSANAQFETGSDIRNIISYAVGITLLVVAGFGIYNILNMMIYDKMDSIAILKATGFTGSDVQWIFIWIALTIGVMGSFTGIIAGYGLVRLIDQIPFETAALPTIRTYPVSYAPLYYIIGVSFGILTTFFAGWLPAIRASHVDPVEIIRGK